MITRTQQSKPEQSKFNGKWAVVIENYVGVPGDEYLANSMTTAAVFDTEDEAYAGGDRALDCLEKTGRYPNMCEPF